MQTMACICPLPSLCPLRSALCALRESANGVGTLLQSLIDGLNHLLPGLDRPEGRDHVDHRTSRVGAGGLEGARLDRAGGAAGGGAREEVVALLPGVLDSEDAYGRGGDRAVLVHADGLAVLAEHRL